MHRDGKWKKLSWRHPVWDLVRYYRSLRLRGKRNSEFLDQLNHNKSISIKTKKYPLENEIIDLLFEYLKEEEIAFNMALEALRNEEDALEFCSANNLIVGKTETKNDSHHQSSKAMIAAVTGISNLVCSKFKITSDSNPQKRCIWIDDKNLHVTSRNLDGAIPDLVNPTVIWEIKEYWGKTGGGSKMSDAVYECQLVGRELREFEEESKKSITHIVFLDGKDQWACRKSDLIRFIDLMYQGLIDHLIIGRQVEEEWERTLTEIIS